MTEALLRKIPMLIPYMLGGQEKENRDYLVREEVAIWVGNLRQITEVVSELIHHPEKLLKMKSNMSRISSEFSIESSVEDLRNL